MPLLALFAAPSIWGQVFQLTKEQMLPYSAQNPFDRFAVGRPKVPDDLYPEKRRTSRALTLLPCMNYQTAMDMDQKGGVPVVDAAGVQFGGVVDDNPAYYIMKTAGAGLVGYYRAASDPRFDGGRDQCSGDHWQRHGDAADVVFGDAEWVHFIPPSQLKGLIDKARAGMRNTGSVTPPNRKPPCAAAAAVTWAVKIEPAAGAAGFMVRASGVAVRWTE